MPLILGANSLAGGYQIKNSARFNIGSSDFLEKTLSGTSTNRKLCTFSFWVKRSDISDTNQGCIGGFLTSSSGQNLQIGFYNNAFYAFYYDGTITRLNLVSSALARDVSAWYHVVVAIDTTQATTSNRVKMYVNGVQVTSFTTSDYPVQNIDFPMTNGFTTHIGKYTFIGSTTEYFSGYLSEIYFIDGQQLTPSSFGEEDEDSGIWKPKAYTGTYGTNGFYLDFEDSANLGNDMSGNNNDFTVNNLTSIDQTTDTPTNNFATLNSLIKDSASYLSQGNLRGYQASASHASLVGTLGVSVGKWYFEGKLNTIGSVANASAIGVCGLQCAVFKDTAYNAGDSVNDMVYVGGGDKQFNSTASAYGNSFTTGDIIGVALDMDNNYLYFSKNGTFQNSGVPTSGATGTGAIALNSGDTYFPLIGLYGGTIWEMNFGNPFVSGNSYTDGAGYGNFSYSVPSGYYALCTKNLANFG